MGRTGPAIIMLPPGPHEGHINSMNTRQFRFCALANKGKKKAPFGAWGGDGRSDQRHAGLGLDELARHPRRKLDELEA
jgi:hypothetical protein